MIFQRPTVPPGTDSLRTSRMSSSEAPKSNETISCEGSGPCRHPGIVRRFFQNPLLFLQPWNKSYSREERCVLTGRIRSGILSRSYVFLLVLLVLFAGLVFHVGTIQLGNHEYYARQARGISMKTRDAAAHRGSILDLNGNIFAGDLATRRPRRAQAFRRRPGCGGENHRETPWH